MLAIPSVTEMKNILYQLQHTEYRGRIAAIARFEDERRDLISLGADVAFNYYEEVGAGFAEEMIPKEFLKKRAEQLSPIEFHILAIALMPTSS